MRLYISELYLFMCQPCFTRASCQQTLLLSRPEQLHVNEEFMCVSMRIVNVCLPVSCSSLLMKPFFPHNDGNSFITIVYSTSGNEEVTANSFIWYTQASYFACDSLSLQSSKLIYITARKSCIHCHSHHMCAANISATILRLQDHL